MDIILDQLKLYWNSIDKIWFAVCIIIIHHLIPANIGRTKCMLFFQ